MARRSLSGQPRRVVTTPGAYDVSENDDVVCLASGWSGGTIALPGPSTGHSAPNDGDAYTIADPLLVIGGGALTIAGGGFDFVAGGARVATFSPSSLLSSSSGFGSTGVVFIFDGQQDVWIVLGVGGTPIVPPVVPPLPPGANFLWEIDAGRTVVGGALTRWVDQASGFVATPPGGDTGFVVTAAQYQGFDGQNIPDATHAETATAATSLTTAQTLTLVGKLDGTNYGRINAAFKLGTAGCEPLLGSGTYFTGSSNVLGCNLPAQALFAFGWNFTPGSGALVGTFNGWPVGTAFQTTATDFSGTPPAIAGGGVELGPFIAGPPFEWGGDFEEAGQWPILSPTDLAQAFAHYAAKFLLPNAAGYLTGGSVLMFNGISQFQLLLVSYAIVKLYTTATSFTIGVQNVYPTGTTPANPTGIVVVIDGVYDHTIAIADQSAPFAPVSYPVSSAKLDGHPHVVELWQGTSNASDPGTDTQGLCIAYVQDPTAATKIYPTDTSPAPELVIVGDSNTVGFGDADPATGAFTLIRLTPTQWHGRVAFWSQSGGSVFNQSQYDGTFAATADRVAALLAEGSGGVQVVWVELGTNDWNIATYLTVGDFGTAYGAMVDAIHSAAPAAIIVCQAPIVSTSEADPNANGWTLVEERAEIASQAASRPAFCLFLDASQPYHGVAAPSAADLVDGFHLNAAGQAQYNALDAKFLSVNFPGETG